MKKSKGGRPTEYTKDELLKILLNYTQEHPKQTVRLSELQEATGIKRYIWSYNLKDEIDKINREIQSVATAGKGTFLPSVEEILLSCKGDEKKLAVQIQTLTDMVNDMSKYQDAAKAVKGMEADYKNRLDELECMIKEKDKQIEALYEQINRLVIDSDNPNKRKEQGIKSNVIEYTPENMKQFNEMVAKLLL